MSELETPVKAYLLGTLPDHEADALEARYFADTRFFQQVQDVETKLIRAYLVGGLPPNEKQLFEKRYLHVPALQKRVAEVRKLTPAAPKAGFGWAPALALAGGLAAIVGTWWILQKPQGPVQVARSERPAEALPTYRLMPGIAKGTTAETAKAIAGQPARFQLELPGRRQPASVVVELLQVQVAGGFKPVWKSGTLESETLQSTHVIQASPPAEVLQRGEYAIRVLDSASQPLETYLLQVVDP